MNSYVILLRGVNVGGKNKIVMAELRRVLEQEGFQQVSTYIQSGNVLLQSELDPETLGATIEVLLSRHFTLDSATIRVVALGYEAYRTIILQAPAEFGQAPGSYRYNVLFLMNVSPAEIMDQIEVRTGVDTVWPGERVFYFRNSIADASKSRLSKMIQKPFYQNVTIRNWNTTTQLFKLLEAHKKTALNKSRAAK